MPTPKKSAAAPKPARTRKPPAKRAAKPNPLAPRSSARPTASAAIMERLPEDVVAYYGNEMIALIIEDQPAGAPASAIARLLIAGMRLQLAPNSGDLYLGEDRVRRNGGEPGWNVVATRDALLKHAERQDRYRGIDFDEVHVNDEFARVAPDGGGTTLRARAGVAHTYGKPAERGELIGAWSVVETANPDGTLRPPTYFYAPLEKYQPTGDLADDDPWKRFPGACIIKAGQLWTLRVGLGLEDVVGQEELDRARRAAAPTAAAAASATPEPAEDGIAYPDTDEGRALAAAVARARDLRTPGWPDAKIRAHLMGCTPDTPVGKEFLQGLVDRLTALNEEVAAERDAAGEVAAPAPTPAETESEGSELERLIARRDELERQGNDVDPDDEVYVASMLDEITALDARIAELSGEVEDIEDNASARAEAMEKYAALRARYEQIRAERKLMLEGGQNARADELERELTELASLVMSAEGAVRDLGGDVYAAA